MESLDYKKTELESYIKEEAGIKRYYLDNAIAWVLNNCDIEKREDIPHIFGSGTPAQRAFSDIIAELLKIYAPPALSRKLD